MMTNKFAKIWSRIEVEDNIRDYVFQVFEISKNASIFEEKVENAISQSLSASL